jgi:hypothetical protein
MKTISGFLYFSSVHSNRMTCRYKVQICSAKTNFFQEISLSILISFVNKKFLVFVAEFELGVIC